MYTRVRARNEYGTVKPLRRYFPLLLLLLLFVPPITYYAYINIIFIFFLSRRRKRGINDLARPYNLSCRSGGFVRFIRVRATDRKRRRRGDTVRSFRNNRPKGILCTLFQTFIFIFFFEFLEVSPILIVIIYIYIYIACKNFSDLF